MLRYKHLLGFLVLAVFLGVPFALRTMSPLLEIYPCVILPSGASLARSSDEEYRLDKTNLIGIDRVSGERKRILPASFLRPVPGRYFFRIADREFGLIEETKRPLSLKYVPPLRGKRFSLPRKGVDDRERAELIRWLRDRLEKLGCDPSTLVVSKTQSSIDKATLSARPFETTHETVIDLSR